MPPGYQWREPLDLDRPPSCECGCGKPVSRKGRRWNRWLKGHHKRKHYDAAAPTAREARINERLKRVYGISLAEYEAMLAAQAGQCAICYADEPGKGRDLFCVDHDHETGAVRGLLCHACNSAIGLLEDDPETIERAAAYVRGEKPWLS